VLVTASGTDGSTPFSRQDLTLAVVSVPGEPGTNPCDAAAAVGGIAELPDTASGTVATSTSRQGLASPPYATIAAAAAAGLLALAAGAWYVRRRWRAS
jgi:hypothetical protein